MLAAQPACLLLVREHSLTEATCLLEAKHHHCRVKKLRYCAATLRTGRYCAQENSWQTCWMSGLIRSAWLHTCKCWAFTPAAVVKSGAHERLCWQADDRNSRVKLIMQAVFAARLSHPQDTILAADVAWSVWAVLMYAVFEMVSVISKSLNILRCM